MDDPGCTPLASTNGATVASGGRVCPAGEAAAARKTRAARSVARMMVEPSVYRRSGELLLQARAQPVELIGDGAARLRGHDLARHAAEHPPEDVDSRSVQVGDVCRRGR